MRENTFNIKKIFLYINGYKHVAFYYTLSRSFNLYQ